jgi:putative PIG3 family NAD(P)H quinone oxidoreductase
MLAVLPCDPARGPEPRLAEQPRPHPGPGEVLLRVGAAALNRADLLQLRALYPPPPGESAIPGLECAGEVAELGEEADGWRVGERAMALLAGGGQAEWVAAPVGQLMPVPDGLSSTDAAALPEAALTSWTNLVVEGALVPGEILLVSGAASGVGTFAVQLGRELGARVWVAGRSRERLERLRELGAERVFVLSPSLGEELREASAGRGVDLVLDLVGGGHVPTLLSGLAPCGRLVLVGLLAGARAELDLARILRQRLRLIGSVLRARSRAEKAALVESFWSFAASRLADGRLRPVVDRVLPFAEVADAYRVMESSSALGKIVLQVAVPSASRTPP